MMYGWKMGRKEGKDNRGRTQPTGKTRQTKWNAGRHTASTLRKEEKRIPDAWAMSRHKTAILVATPPGPFRSTTPSCLSHKL